MGERRKAAFRVGFDVSLRLEFHGVKVTSDAGLLAFAVQWNSRSRGGGVSELRKSRFTKDETGQLHGGR